MTANAQFAADTSGRQALELFNAKQFAAAKDQATAGAASGSVVSMYVLGEIYSSGKGAAQDYAEAASWFLKAAGAGYPPAMNAIGSARETGHGVEQNLALAEGWYQRSADKGDAVGMNNLGHMFEIGGGVPKDYAQAFQWYLKGAEAGASAAMVNVGLMYENGHAVNQSGQPALQDFGEALKWYEKAAKAGDANGMYRLALSYDIGKGTAPNRPLAMEWYRKAADAGSDAARARLGNATSGSQATVGNPLPNLAGRGATGQDGVYRAGNGVSQPSLVSKVEPEYSETARKLRAEGVVVLQIVVQSDGTPRNLRVMRSLNYGLDQKAIAAVQQWRFNPGMKGENAVAVAATVEVNFRLLKGGPLDFWYSGSMAFALETGVTMPVVENGTMAKGVRKISDESVVLEFTVDSSGSVKNIHAVHGSESAAELLTRNLTTWKFQHAVKDGQPVEATGRVRFVKGQGDDASKLPLVPPPLTGSNPPAPRRAPQENAPPRALNLLAWYKFGSDGSDATGVSRPFSLSSNTVFRDGSLYLNGVYDVSVEKAVAIVPRLNYLHFTAALDFKAETFNAKKRVILYGGTAYRWWGLGWNNGFLELTLNNGRFSHVFEAALSQGAWHNVICSADLSAGVIRTVLDGKALEDVQLPQSFRLEILGSPNELSDKQFTFANYGIGTTFQGYVNNLRIYGDSLSAAELHSLYPLIANQTPANQTPANQTPANQTPDPVRTAISPGEGPHDTMVNRKDGQVYVRIPPGAFTMGCSEGDTECDGNEKPPHTEQIESGFWLGQTEVTQAAYQRVTGGNPSTHKGDRLPVETVTWNEAVSYCLAIGGHLPTEIEWEYAARAGTKGARYGSPDAVAWHSGNSGGTNQPVAQKQPNALGLYDMLGNVWEWMEDSYEGTPSKILRGGSSYAAASNARASRLVVVEPSAASPNRGFRCAGEWPEPQKTPPGGSAMTPVSVPVGPGMAGPDGAYRTGNGVSGPTLLRKVEPVYSEAARKGKLEGVVVLHVVVDAKGNAVNPRVMKSLGLGLDEKAIEAVRKWKFAPGHKDGKPVAVAATVEINFRLR